MSRVAWLLAMTPVLVVTACVATPEESESPFTSDWYDAVQFEGRPVAEAITVYGEFYTRAPTGDGKHRYTWTFVGERLEPREFERWEVEDCVMVHHPAPT